MLQEGLDYYMNEDGLLVLTAAFLKNRGYCCGNGCRHCPYDYERVKEPRRSQLLAARQQNQQDHGESNSTHG